MTDQELARFMAKVDVTPTCWLWTAGTSNGYGRFQRQSADRVDGRLEMAHRVSFAHFVGAIPEGACVLHSCDTPACVNPAHLRIGDRADNMRDCLERGRHHKRQTTHCPQGHPYDDANTYVNPKGHRYCRKCGYASWRRYVQRRRALVSLLVLAAFLYATAANAHLVRVPDHPKRSVLENRAASQAENLAHARYVARHGAGRNQQWHRLAVRWLTVELLETRRALRPAVTDWAAIQMHYGNRLAADSAGDPWPNCPDPHDGSGSSWYDTVRCENGGSWLDSPGYYRCGLQFDPMWERHYGRRFCP